MKQALDQPAERLGLMATGSSRCWNVSVDESLDGDGFSLEIEGPQTYLVFQLRELSIIARAVSFLRGGLRSAPGSTQLVEGDETMLTLGRFGSASVSLLWDNEDFPRCFLVIGPKARSTLRLTFRQEDIQMISDALNEALSELPQDATS
jgi:hypothetical protein